MPRQPPIVTLTLNTAIDRVLAVEHFAIGAHLPAEELSRYPAGKGINLSRALARLGRDNIATGFVGQDDSQRFEQLLKATTPGRAVCQLLPVRGRTRENITLLDPVNHTDTHVRTAGYELTRQDVQRIISKLGLMARADSIVVISGSLPPGMAVADLDTLIYMIIGRKARVVLDLSGKLLARLSSVELSLAGDSGTEPEPAAAPGAEAESGSGARMIWLIKPNQQELAEALGLDGQPSERQLLAAGRRLTRRVRWVALTLGAGGAILFGPGGEAWRCRCDVGPDEVVSTVGCGDCLLAGVLDGLARGEEPERVLKRGVAAATANAVRPGVAEFDAALVSSMADRTVVERLGAAD